MSSSCKQTCSRGDRRGSSSWPRAALLALALALAVAASGPTAAGAASATTAARGCANATLTPRSRDLGAVDAATLCLVNQIRVSSGLSALRENGQLGRVAMRKVGTMLRADYFADVGPGGQTVMALLQKTRYPVDSTSVAVGENIAWGTGSLASPVSVVAAWMASPPHRELILSPAFRDAAVASTAAIPAVLDEGRQGATYALEFGARRG